VTLLLSLAIAAVVTWGGMRAWDWWQDRRQRLEFKRYVKGRVWE
jgi:hypothetical protein